ncbi:hypothetical protein [Kosakonia sp.]|uniref:hypothetical protein n=1 Tax=Kosakonia sp. TaxID=1916651 RepID=UPI0028B1BD17|nr:hypothetical protein [Kosakonia sp.]
MEMKAVVLSILFMASLPVMAATNSITKAVTAPVINIYSTGTGGPSTTNLYVSSTDFPKGTLNASKKLTMVRYNAAAYVSAFSDKAQLCYFRPYSAGSMKCIDITGGSSSSTTQFNDLPFDLGVQVQFRHTLTGKPGDQARPSRQESITLDYSY